MGVREAVLGQKFAPQDGSSAPDVLLAAGGSVLRRGDKHVEAPELSCCDPRSPIIGRNPWNFQPNIELEKKKGRILK